MDYTFRDEEEAASRRTWIGASAFALAVVIGAILAMRAASVGKNRSAAAAPAPDARDVPAKVAEPLPAGGGAASQPGVAVPPDPLASGNRRGSKQDNAKDKPDEVPPARLAPLPAASGAVRDLIARGQEAERRDDLAAARAAYEEALASDGVGDALPLAESRLGAVMVALVTSPREMPEKIDHAIVSGDRIAILARRHGTTADLIASANGISNPNNIKLGDRIRILDKAKFEISVSKSENWLLVTMNGKFFKRYTVGTGRYNKTPVGTFKITDKIKEPNWWKDNVEIPYGDERNILGTRWMALSATGSTPPAKGYGIHGTWDNSSLGQQSSAGCVRMANSDVEELFMIVPEGTPVTITE